MRIDRLRIKNFKAFDDREFTFPEQFTVLIGDNGTGKTSVLDTLAIAAGSYLLGIDGVAAIAIEKDEIRRVSYDRQSFEYQFPVQIEAVGKIYETELRWLRSLEYLTGRTTREKSRSIIALAQKHQKLVRAGNRTENLPLLAYHGTGRLWAEHKAKVEYKRAGSRTEGYLDCLSPKSSSKQFLSWYKTYFDSRQKFDYSQDREVIDTFNHAITTMVPEWQKIAFDFVEDDLVGFYQITPNETKYLPYRLLSDGFRNMIGIVADIAYRCIKLNPHLGQAALIETEGIVLIDEIDLHLHPKWQKRIVEDLKRVFPKLQFVVTTHSPFVVQSLKNTELINLNVDTGLDPFRMSLEEVAETEMLVDNVTRSQRFDEMTALATEYYRLIAAGKNSKNSEEVVSLRQKLNELEEVYGNDPAFVALLKAERQTAAL